MYTNTKCKLRNIKSKKYTHINLCLFPPACTSAPRRQSSSASHLPPAWKTTTWTIMMIIIVSIIIFFIIIFFTIPFYTIIVIIIIIIMVTISIIILVIRHRGKDILSLWSTHLIFSKQRPSPFCMISSPFASLNACEILSSQDTLGCKKLWHLDWGECIT